MPLTASTYKGKLIHLTDEPAGYDGLSMHAGCAIKTLCGLTLQDAIIGLSGGDGLNRCPRCGQDADFEAALAERRARYAAAEKLRQAEQERRNQAARAIANARRTFIHDLAAILTHEGIAIDVKDHYGGATATITHDGSIYELRCRMQ